MQMRGNLDQLVEKHVGFARVLVRRLGGTLPPHADMEALDSDALFGLLLAARTFDPCRGVAFTTYAAKRIHGAMLDGLRQRQGCSRTEGSLRVMSLAMPMCDTDGREVTLGDVLAGDQEPVGAALEREEEVGRLLQAVGPASRRMVREYYFDSLAQEEIGRRHGISASRVSQRLNVARQRMREVACAN